MSDSDTPIYDGLVEESLYREDLAIPGMGWRESRVTFSDLVKYATVPFLLPNGVRLRKFETG